MPWIPASNIRRIVVHYSATPIENDYSVADIEKMHKARGFKSDVSGKSIGYHYFIRKNGTVENGRAVEDNRVEMGAHVSGHNGNSVGICFEGGVSKKDVNKGYDTRTPEQRMAMTNLIESLLKKFPGAEVLGHRDLGATQCPGFDVRSWWAQHRSDVIEPGMPVKIEKPPLPTQTQWDAFWNAFLNLFIKR